MPRGVVQLGDSGGAGEREAALLPTPPKEARVRGDFYSDTAEAGLCLVMVTARTPCLPPARSDGGARAWATEAEPERGNGGVSERPAPRLRARRAGSAPAAVPWDRRTRPGQLGRLWVPVTLRRARSGRLKSYPFVGRRDTRGGPSRERRESDERPKERRLHRGPGTLGRWGA